MNTAAGVTCILVVRINVGSKTSQTLLNPKKLCFTHWNLVDNHSSGCCVKKKVAGVKERYQNKVVKITSLLVLLDWSGAAWLCNFNAFSRFSWESEPIFVIWILFSVNHSNVYSQISWLISHQMTHSQHLKLDKNGLTFHYFTFFLWDWSHLIIETIFLTTTVGFVPYFLGAAFACEHFLPGGFLMTLLCCTHCRRQAFLVSGHPVLGSLWIWRCLWRDLPCWMSHQ